MGEMKFESRLTESLVPPPMDPDMNILLEIAPALTDKIYDIYTKFVGLDEALPRQELQSHQLVDQYNRFLPLRSWPTKSTRQNAAMHWDEYNKKIQSDQGEEDIVLEPDPCQDQEGYITNKMGQCVKAMMLGGHVDKATAIKRCGKQIHKVSNALDGMCPPQSDTGFFKSLGKLEGPKAPNDISDPFIRRLVRAVDDPTFPEEGTEDAEEF